MFKRGGRYRKKRKWKKGFEKEEMGFRVYIEERVFVGGEFFYYNRREDGEDGYRKVGL